MSSKVDLELKNDKMRQEREEKEMKEMSPEEFLHREPRYKVLRSVRI